MSPLLKIDSHWSIKSFIASSTAELWFSRYSFIDRLSLNERRAERLDYLGVMFGITWVDLEFRKKAGYVAVRMRQTPNELTGEHSCISSSRWPTRRPTPLRWTYCSPKQQLVVRVVDRLQARSSLQRFDWTKRWSDTKAKRVDRASRMWFRAFGTTRPTQTRPGRKSSYGTSTSPISRRFSTNESAIARSGGKLRNRCSQSWHSIIRKWSNSWSTKWTSKSDQHLLYVWDLNSIKSIKHFGCLLNHCFELIPIE